MSSLNLPSRFYAQPQGAVKVNQSHYLAGNIHRVWNFSPNAPWPYCLVSGLQPTLSPHADIRAGGLYVPSAAYTETSTKLPVSLNVLPVTILAVKRVDSGVVDFGWFASQWNGLYTQTSGLNVISSRSSSDFSGSVTPAQGASQSDGFNSLVFTMGGANDLRASVNGGPVAVDTSCFAPTGSVTQIVLGSDMDGSNRADATFRLVAVIDRALSNAELMDLSLNPWQLFRSAPRRIHFDASTGSGVTYTERDFSSAGVSSVSPAAATVKPRASTVAGTSSASVTASKVASVQASSAGSSSVSPASSTIKGRYAAPAGSSTVSASPSSIKPTAFSVAGTSALSAPVSGVRTGQAALVGQSVVSPFRAVIKSGTLVVAGASSVSVASSYLRQSYASIGGSSALVGQSVNVNIVEAIVNLSGTSALASTGATIKGGAAAATGASAVSAVVAAIKGGSFGISGQGALSAVAARVQSVVANAAGFSTVATLSQYTVSSSFAVQGASVVRWLRTIIYPNAIVTRYYAERAPQDAYYAEKTQQTLYSTRDPLRLYYRQADNDLTV